METCSQFKRLKVNNYTFSTSGKRDNCILLKNNKFALIKNVVFEDGLFIICQTFGKAENFFTFPTNSLNLRIALVSELGELEKYQVKEIFSKLCLFPSKNVNYFIAYPMIDTYLT